MTNLWLPRAEAELGVENPPKHIFGVHLLRDHENQELETEGGRLHPPNGIEVGHAGLVGGFKAAVKHMGTCGLNHPK